MSTTTLAQKSSKVTVPLQLPEQSSYTTHRSVTPVLIRPEKTEWESLSEKEQSSELYSPMSSQFLVPPDYEAVFSGHQTLRVSESSTAPVNDANLASPVSAHVASESHKAEDLFSPDFKRVLSEFEKTFSELESEDPKFLPEDFRKGRESPQHSDSDSEFFDCRQAFSDFSEPEDLPRGHDIKYHISEPPSPMPGSSPSVSFLKGSPQETAHPYLRVEDCKRFSSGSESLGDFAYDSEGSRECQTEGDLPECEELPSRDQAGYYDDDDFLGRVRG